MDADVEYDYEGILGEGQEYGKLNKVCSAISRAILNCSIRPWDSVATLVLRRTALGQGDERREEVALWISFIFGREAETARSF